MKTPESTAFTSIPCGVCPGKRNAICCPVLYCWPTRLCARALDCGLPARPNYARHCLPALQSSMSALRAEKSAQPPACTTRNGWTFEHVFGQSPAADWYRHDSMFSPFFSSGFVSFLSLHSSHSNLLRPPSCLTLVLLLLFDRCNPSSLLLCHFSKLHLLLEHTHQPDVLANAKTEATREHESGEGRLCVRLGH